MQKLLREYSIGIPCLFQLSQLGLSLFAFVPVINRIQAIAVDICNEVLFFGACSDSCLSFPVKLGDTFVMGGVGVPRQNIPIISTNISYRFGVLSTAKHNSQPEIDIMVSECRVNSIRLFRR